jgi:hypothetical protein
MIKTETNWTARLTGSIRRRLSALFVDTAEKVLFWIRALELARRYRVVTIGEAVNLGEATILISRHATAWFICLLPDMNRLAILRRFCAVAAIRNSS